MSVLPTSAELEPSSIFAAIDFGGLKSVIVAVSGGSDSLALLHLFHEFGAARSSFPEIIAVTIDHGLRPESKDEARYVGELCQHLGIAHRTVPWTGPKSETGLSAKAREMRYRLLCDAAREANAGMILTGHTCDDQIETFSMRAARATADGSERGLAGMAPATLLERQIWLVRPLLEISRERLREYLRGKGVVWRDDPSNDNIKYERVRVRQMLQAEDRERLKSKIADKTAKRLSLNSNAAAALLSSTSVFDGIRAEIARKEWDKVDKNVRRLSIGVLLATMGGQSFLPSTMACDKALDFMGRLDASGKIALSRCIIEIKAEKALIYREMRSIPTMTIDPGKMVIWDGRYRVSNGAEGPIEIGAAGTQGLHFLKDAEYGGPNTHKASILSSPAIFADGKIICMPAFDDHGKLPKGVMITRHLGLFDNILVGYDELLAQSVAKIFKMQAYTCSPVNQINKN